MSDNKATGLSWDTYWQGAHNASAPKAGGAQDEALKVFWTDIVSAHANDQKDMRLLDVACGNGAVTGIALEAAGQNQIKLISYCTDYSLAAVQATQEKYPAVKGVASDAKHLPFQPASFDVVVSQFGIEYAGPDGFAQCAELVAPAGTFVAIVHLQDSVIYKECEASLQASEKTTGSKVLELARSAFSAAYEVLEGKAEQDVFVQADKNLAPAVEAVKAILVEKGKDVADGTVFGLLGNLGHMYGNIEGYNPQDVFAWIDKMELELHAYSARISSMLNAAVGAQELQSIIELVASKGMSVTRKDQLSFSEGKPAAWILVFEKQP
jgi:SAM-dependent methyltransferase